MKKLIYSISSVLLIFSLLLCSCGKKQAIRTIKIDGNETEVESLISLDGEAVPFDMFRFCFLGVKDSMSDADFTKKETLKKLLDDTVEQVEYVYAVEDFADKYGYTLSKDKLKEIDDTMKSTFEQAGGATDYRSLLDENHLTHECYERILKSNALLDDMASSLIGTDKEKNKIIVSEDEMVKSYSEDYSRLIDFYFEVPMYNEQTGGYLDADEYEKKAAEVKAKADAAYAALNGGKPFKELVDAELGEGTYEKDSQTYYPTSSLSENIGYDVSSIKPGSYSEVFLFQSTYHILLRLENDIDYIKQNKMSEVATYYGQKHIDELILERCKEFKVTKSEYFDKLDADSIS